MEKLIEFGTVILLGIILTLCCAVVTGCAESPYYVSGVSVGGNITDASKDGTVTFNIAPNPYHRAPHPGKEVIPAESPIE